MQYTHIHTYVHTYTHMHVYMHIHTCIPLLSLPCHILHHRPIQKPLSVSPWGLAGGKCHFGSITRPLRHLGTINCKFNFHLRRRGRSTVTKEPWACAPRCRVQQPRGQDGGRCHHTMSSGFPALAGLNNSSMWSLLGTTVLGESTPAAACLLRGPPPAAFFC